jgi:hypothetical protein
MSCRHGALRNIDKELLLHIYPLAAMIPHDLLLSRTHSFSLAAMAKSEVQSRVDENAVVAIEKDWTTEEEKKAKWKYAYMRHQLLIDFHLITDQARLADHALVGNGLLLPP